MTESGEQGCTTHNDKPQPRTRVDEKGKQYREVGGGEEAVGTLVEEVKGFIYAFGSGGLQQTRSNSANVSRRGRPIWSETCLSGFCCPEKTRGPE